MSKKHLMIFIMTIIVVAFLALIGTSYAYFQVRIIENQNETSIDVESKYLSVIYEDGTASFSGSTDGYLFPGDTFTKTFNVTNNGNAEATFHIVLRDVINEFTRLKDWTYELKLGEESLASGIFPLEEKSVIYRDGILAVGETKTYTLIVNYLETTESQNVDIDKNIQATIDIENAKTTLNTATEGTLLYAINRDNEITAPKTIPGREASATDEAVLASTEDDYGYSYYYRGNVVNNFVNYSGMCWRVVRIQGDGTIKLALADENGECNAETYSVNNTISAFVDGMENMIYLGSSNTYTEEDLIYETSAIPYTLNTWATKEVERSGETVTNLDTSKLASTEWCNDMSQTSENTDDSGNVTSYYGAYDRLYNSSTAKPSLKCNSVGIDGSTTKKFVSSIGVLSADEVAFAGSKKYVSGLSYNYYLQTNASGYGYWTMSPYSIPPYSTVYVWYVNSSGYLVGGQGENQGLSVRPSIVLKKDVKVTTDDASTYAPGTQENPYVVID